MELKLKRAFVVAAGLLSIGNLCCIEGFNSLPVHCVVPDRSCAVAGAQETEDFDG